MAERENIYQGDSYPVAYEVRKPNPDPQWATDSRGIPAEPTHAIARVLNTQEQEFLELGGPGIIEGECDVTPATGTQIGDRGAIVEYTVAPEFTQEPGIYNLYITAFFADGAILTENRAYRVLEFR